MNYRHIYHAGNPADVFKHWLLTLLLDKLIEKPKPFFVLDTHSGLGIYPLDSIEAQKTKEHEAGILELLPKLQDPNLTDNLFENYLAIVNKYLPQKQYPGSPEIISQYLREQDRLFLCELHPKDFEVLQNNYLGMGNIYPKEQDGYMALKSLLPPQEGRGLIFIDPPFELKTEFDLIIKNLEIALARFAHGIYAIWFPHKDPHAVNKFYRQLLELQLNKLLYVEVTGNSGMVVINPPWMLKEKIESGLPILATDYKVEFIERNN